ncbi:peptide-methionine (S)-S-oxide reductase MsrA [Actomonas aquatica]|uniref:Peptide methionine sulfoxide reductase MsrA n=1 Tax=Actomonas aquatica TaxID=2866162 RepID=A0ABZ1C5N6_9BACT|nr:peptide-methionine (S)-S-oxide reductase MsrA [Opitutus sp. WL0086]WRQ86965.1 peptide-methionine (S)-S-oxide reductase MsrA [Opitutus sp. WL0086]
MTQVTKAESLILGGGCFWCVEAAYQMLPGVLAVESGYSGGHDPAPTYEAVCTGETGHAEVARITYDPSKVSLGEVLALFWRIHDPTTLNRQGDDVGTQYRSVIFYAGETQRVAAEASREAAKASWGDRIVTQIEPLTQFFPAEGYHQNYYARNPEQGYCRAVIRPKLDKVKRALEAE